MRHQTAVNVTSLSQCCVTSTARDGLEQNPHPSLADNAEAIAEQHIIHHNVRRGLTPGGAPQTAVSISVQERSAVFGQSLSLLPISWPAETSSSPSPTLARKLLGLGSGPQQCGWRWCRLSGIRCLGSPAQRGRQTVGIRWLRSSPMLVAGNWTNWDLVGNDPLGVASRWTGPARSRSPSAGTASSARHRTLL